MRERNVAKVTNPHPGSFCITPAVPLNLSEIYPLLSIEWGLSRGESLLAYFRDTSVHNQDCGPGVLQVQTYDFSSGTPVRSNNVAFVLVIE